MTQQGEKEQIVVLYDIRDCVERIAQALERAFPPPRAIRGTLEPIRKPETLSDRLRAPRDL